MDNLQLQANFEWYKGRFQLAVLGFVWLLQHWKGIETHLGKFQGKPRYNRGEQNWPLYGCMRKVGTCRNPPNLLAMVRIDKMMWISSANFRLTQLGIHQPKLSPCLEGCSYIGCSFIQKLCSLHLICRVSLVVKSFAQHLQSQDEALAESCREVRPLSSTDGWTTHLEKKHMTFLVKLETILTGEELNIKNRWEITNWTTSKQNYNHSWIGMVKWRLWQGVDCQSSGLSPRRGAFQQFSICAVGKRAFSLELCWKGN